MALRAPASLLVVLLWPSVAPAEDLRWAVEVPAPLPRPVRDRPAPVVLALPGEGEWAAAPPLLPVGTALSPPEVEAALGWRDGLRVRVRGEAEVTLLLDPDGLRARWWKVHLGDDARVEVCDFEGTLGRWDRPLGSGAAVCRPDDGVEAVAGKDGWEVAFSAVAPLTSQARLGLWAAREDHAGSWTGAVAARPEAAAPLFPESGARVVVRPDLATGRFRAEITAPEGTEGPWAWRLLVRDVAVGQGTVEVAPGSGGHLSGRFQGAFPDRRRMTLEVRGPAGARRAPAAVRVFTPERDLTLLSPVYGDTLRVGFHLAAPTDLPVAVHGVDGRDLGSASVRLPRGEGVLVVQAEPTWPAAVRLSVGTLLDAPAVRGGPP